MTDTAEAAGSPRGSGTALATVFVLAFVFVYSDDMVEFVLDLFGVRFAGPGPWLVFALDVILAITAAVLTWGFAGPSARTGLPRNLLRSRWGAGAALVVLTHGVSIATTTERDHLSDTGRVWIGILTTVLFVVAIGLMLDGLLGEGPGSRIWLAPILIGTFVAQVASKLWYPVLDVPGGCANEISPNYFSDAGNIIPVLLLAIGVELNHLRRAGSDRDTGARVAPIFTVIVLCIAELLTFTMLVKSDLGQRCGLAAVWHEYISFVVTAQALAIGLTTVAWLLIGIQANADDH